MIFRQQNTRWWEGALTAFALILFLTACPDLTAPSTAGNDNGPGSRGCTGNILSAGTRQWFGPGGLSSSPLCAPASTRTAVRMLLERTPGPWFLPADGNDATSVPPSVTVSSFGGGPCMRDQYVGAAALSAYGVEAFSRQGNATLVGQWTTSMWQNLQNAYALCSNTPINGVTCATVQYIPCADLKTMLG